MNSPHWLCKNCGIIILNAGFEPNPCQYCNNIGFFYLGYEGEYDPIDVRARHNIIFNPSKFTTQMQEQYWTNIAPEEKEKFLQYIQRQAEQVRIRHQESYEPNEEDAYERLKKELEKADTE